VKQLGLALALVLGTACGGAGAPQPSASATPIPPIAGAVLVTRANDRGTVYARVGTEYEWRVDAPDGVVLVHGVQNYLLVRGTQAIWTAAAPGTATISATGTVICASGQACILLAVLFTTTVVVAP
jgi:hypothetical protein